MALAPEHLDVAATRQPDQLDPYQPTRSRRHNTRLYHLASSFTLRYHTGMPDKRPHIAAKVSPDLKDRVQRACKREDRRISAVIRIALIRYCERSEREAAAETATAS